VVYVFFAIVFFHHQRFIRLGAVTKLKAYLCGKPAVL